MLTAVLFVRQVRRFDWISRFESGVKRRIAAEEPTVVQPQRYRDRLCQAMEKYFVIAPTKYSLDHVALQEGMEAHP